MKKHTLTVLVLLLSVSLAACGNSNSGKPETDDGSAALEAGTTTGPQDEPEAASAAQESEPQEDGDETDTEEESVSYTLEEYVELMQDVAADMSASLEESGLAVYLEARGNSLVYVYQYTIDVGDADAVKAALEESMSSLDETNQGLLADLQKVVPDAKSLVYEYLDMEGNVITSIEYE